MIKNRNRRRNYNINSYDNSDTCYTSNANYSYKNNYHKNCNYNKLKYINNKKNFKESQKNAKCFLNYRNINDFDSFYPKNYPQKINMNIPFSDNHEKNNNYISQDNNNIFNYVNSGKNNDNLIIDKINNKQTIISPLIELNMKNNLLDSEKDEDIIAKKIAIKNIPHPKRKPGYPCQKKLYYQKKEEINKESEDLVSKISKGRKLSFNLSLNSDSSTKYSFSTLNSSNSSYQEKNVSDNIIIKNKFDNENDTNNALMQTNTPINKHLENTEILKVVVKISETESAIFKIKRYDDLFITVNLFCEINSVDEKFMRPILIKVLNALNMIYQIYNCDLPKENIDILKNIKKNVL